MTIIIHIPSIGNIYCIIFANTTMNWHEIAEFTHEHQLALFNIRNGNWTISEMSDPLLCQHLEMEYSRGMKKFEPEIKRDVKSPLEFSFQRGHKHKQLHHAVKSFLVAARDAYITHLSTTALCDKFDKDVLSQLFKKPPHKVKNGVYTASKDACFYLVVDNVVHHVRLHLTIRRCVADNYTGHLQVIAHYFNNEGGSDESVDTIHKRLMSLASDLEQQLFCD